MENWNHKKFLFATIVLVIALLFIHEFIGNRHPPVEFNVSNPVEILQYGKKRNFNIVGIEPFMTLQDYATSEHFYKKMDSYLQKAKPYLTPHTLVVFPEHIGTWLVVAGESYKIHQSRNIYWGIFRFVIKNIPGVLKELDFLQINVISSILRWKSPVMQESYYDTFSKLAKKYGIYIIGGSIVLPDPYLKNQLLYIRRKGKLYNVSLVFSPDGLPVQIIHKEFLSSWEKPYWVSFKKESQKETQDKILKTNSGNFLILLGNNSWKQENNFMNIPLKGVLNLSSSLYLRKSQPLWKSREEENTFSKNISSKIDQISQKEAGIQFSKYLQKRKLQFGYMSILRGIFWNIATYGSSSIWIYPKLYQIPNSHSGKIIIVWL